MPVDLDAIALLATAMGSLYGTDRTVFERYVAEARAHLDEAAFAARWAAGQAMTLDQATAYAVEEPEPG